MTPSGRSLWTWILASSRVARDEHRLADRLEVRLDRGDVERRARLGRGAGTPSRSRTRPSRRAARDVVGASLGGVARGAARPPRATGRPRAASSAPWNSRSRPCPPESTTCASRRIGSSDGVFATARSAASTVAASTVSTLLSRSAAATAAADASRMTVRIVPSTGLATALYAVFVPASSACARSRPLNRFLPWSPCAMPGEDLARDDARVAAGAHERAEARGVGHPVGVGIGPGPVRLLERGADRRQHVRAGVAVRDREDVERVDLVDVRLEAGDRGPERREEPGAVARAAGHQATSVPDSARSDGRGSPVPAPADRRDAVLVTEPPDPDRDPVRLPADRVPERVADRRLDLAGDLGDGQAVRDGELEVDRQLVADLEVEARLGEPEPLEEPAARARRPRSPSTP